MENEGLSAKTGSVWDSYYYGLLPTEHDIELMHQRNRYPDPEFLYALIDTSISIEQIFNKYFSHVPNIYRKECMRDLRDTRRILLNGSVK